MLQPARPLHRVALILVGVFLANRGAEVHAGNPANYDPLFALLLLGYFLLIDAWERRRHPVWLAAAGLCLSLLELTRPFMIFLLPLFLLVEWHRIHLNAPRRGLALAAFLLPVVVLSGGWHLHLYLAHDHQITWTNISGYNLQRAWEDFDPEIRAVQHLDQLPRNGELWADLNTTEIYMRSEELKRMIIGKIRENPAGAAAHVVDRLATFVSSPTRIYGHDPQGLGIEIYRKLVSALVLLLPVLCSCLHHFPAAPPPVALAGPALVACRIDAVDRLAGDAGRAGGGGAVPLHHPADASGCGWLCA